MAWRLFGQYVILHAHQTPLLTIPPEMSHLSTSLRTESEKYRRAARKVNYDAMLRQYAPLGAVAFLLILFLWWRFF
jgi:hypothetical protein